MRLFIHILVSGVFQAIVSTTLESSAKFEQMNSICP